MKCDADRLKAIVKRQAAKLQNGESEESIYKYLLVTCGWQQHEVEKIIQAARTYKKRGE